MLSQHFLKITFRLMNFVFNLLNALVNEIKLFIYHYYLYFIKNTLLRIGAFAPSFVRGAWFRKSCAFAGVGTRNVILPMLLCLLAQVGGQYRIPHFPKTHAHPVFFRKSPNNKGIPILEVTPFGAVGQAQRIFTAPSQFQ